uniref:Major facilitator superfamily (MFS) profile domain-containing protein n=1 Tax=Strigamia maritima TaxID=126957 RepID=T1J4J4_STRMM
MPGLAEDSEEASLVGREATLAMTSYTEEGTTRIKTVRIVESGATASGEPISDGIEEATIDSSLVTQFHEDAIRQTGSGVFHWLLLLFAGLGMGAENAELFVVAFLIPSAEEDLCMENTDKTCLAGVTFSWMLVGAITWGCIADRVGRRTALLVALVFNSTFGAIAAFMPNYGLLLLTRLLSAVGAGGLLPVIIVYYCEFFGRRDRGRRATWLLAGWALGGLFVALMAWAAIPRTGVALMEEKKQYFSSWRVFVLLCSLPSFAALITLIFLPESPRFLLEVGRDIEAMFVYQSVYKNNHINDDPAAQYQLTELELPTRRQLYGGFPPPPSRSVLADFVSGFEAFWSSIFRVFNPPYSHLTFALLLIWAFLAFGYYGVSLWIPEYMQLLRNEDYRSRTRVENHTIFPAHMIFNSSIENTEYEGCVFPKSEFSHIRLNHVIFRNSTFENCSFRAIESSRTFFEASVLLNTELTDTDFYDFRFQDCELINTKSVNTKGPCQLDLNFNFRLSDLFSEAMIGQAVLIPGSLVASLLMNTIGRLRVIGLSMFSTSICASAIWFLKTPTHVVIFEAAFNLAFLWGWIAVAILTAEAYPTHTRATAYGVLTGISRVAAVLGIVVFRGLPGLNLLLPSILTAVVALVIGILTVKLPETKDVLL